MTLFGLFGRKSTEPVRERTPAPEHVELFRAEDGWQYRLRAGRSSVPVSERGLKQFQYALRRARKQFPELEMFRVEADDSLTRVGGD